MSLSLWTKSWFPEQRKIIPASSVKINSKWRYQESVLKKTPRTKQVATGGWTRQQLSSHQSLVHAAIAQKFHWDGEERNLWCGVCLFWWWFERGEMMLCIELLGAEANSGWICAAWFLTRLVFLLVLLLLALDVVLSSGVELWWKLKSGVIFPLRLGILKVHIRLLHLPALTSEYTCVLGKKKSIPWRSLLFPKEGVTHSFWSSSLYVPWEL